MDEIKTKLKHILVQSLRLKRTPESLPDTNLTAELGLDSINSLEFLVWVENEFDIQIEDEVLSVALVDSLDTLADYVCARLAAAGRAEAVAGGQQ